MTEYTDPPGMPADERMSPAEFRVALEGRRPEMRAVADRDAAGGIHRDNGADHNAVARHRRRRADAAFKIDGGGA